MVTIIVQIVLGKVKYAGCLLSKEEQKTIRNATDHILFTTRNSEIKSELFTDLDKLAVILKSHK